MCESQIVYALINPSMPGLVKIGKTKQADVSTRMGQLYSTGVPVPFECIYAVKVQDCTKVESSLHIAFGPYRINPNREFFKINREQAISILKLLGPNDATAEIQSEMNESISQAEKDSGAKLKKRPNMDFHEMGIKDGSVLTFAENSEIEVIVSGSKRVVYQDQSMSLTAATRIVLDLDYNIQPSPKWKYQGRLLKDIYEGYYSDDDA